MESSMKLVEKHCSKYLIMFGECMNQYPHTWQMDCELERRKLARCAETNPEILHIKTTCGKQFQLYESCMKDSQSDAEKCAESFNTFTSCAENAMKTFQVESLDNDSGKGATSKTTRAAGPASVSDEKKKR